MDEFYKTLCSQLIITEDHERGNKNVLARVLDAKESLLNNEQIADDDCQLIDRLLNDILKFQCIIRDHHDSFEKFIKMYN